MCSCDCAERCSEISSLAQLEDLNLSGNPLTRLPRSIGALSHLEILNLSFCNLEAVPDSIGSLTRLLELDLSDNEIAEIPASIGWLTRLSRLALTSNNISQLPVTLGYCVALGASSRNTLELSSNPLSDATLRQKAQKGSDHVVDYLEKQLALNNFPKPPRVEPITQSEGVRIETPQPQHEQPKAQMDATTQAKVKVICDRMLSLIHEIRVGEFEQLRFR